MKKSRARALALTALVSTGVVLTGCPDDPPAETHGYACVEIRPGTSVGTNVAELFAGTAEIRVTVSYLDCLQDFYLNSNTAYAQDGVDGAVVFEEFKDRLCSDEITGRLECEVSDIAQTLSSMVFSMTVKYTGIDPTKIEGRKILVGPLPLESLATCKPDVQVSGNSAVSGYDVNGAQIWSIESFGNPTGRGDLDARGCMTVDVRRN